MKQRKALQKFWSCVIQVDFVFVFKKRLQSMKAIVVTLILISLALSSEQDHHVILYSQVND